MYLREPRFGELRIALPVGFVGAEPGGREARPVVRERERGGAEGGGAEGAAVDGSTAASSSSSAERPLTPFFAVLSSCPAPPRGRRSPTSGVIEAASDVLCVWSAPAPNEWELSTPHGSPPHTRIH